MIKCSEKVGDMLWLCNVYESKNHGSAHGPQNRPIKAVSLPIIDPYV